MKRKMHYLPNTSQRMGRDGKEKSGWSKMKK
jgi:hypothetical protein